jgi:hypothetical protein
MLFRDDVSNVMDQSTMYLAQPAIFATLASPPADEVPRRRIHFAIGESSSDADGLSA